MVKKVFLLFIILLLLTNNCLALSCKFGRPACIASCQAQNCATGYCVGETCVCQRCGTGPPW